MLDTTPTYTYTDISGLNDLKLAARNNQKSALLDVARQFESMFMKMMLKSMRDASFGDPIFDNNQSKFYRDMFDNQLALSLSKGKGMGLAETLARQLGQQLPVQQVEAAEKVSTDKGIPVKSQPGQPAYKAIPETVVPVNPPQPVQPQQLDIPAIVVNRNVTMLDDKARQVKLTQDKQAEVKSAEAKATESKQMQPKLGSVDRFVSTLWPMAEKAAQELNTTPEVLLSQAALETGWGKYISKDGNGRSSNNLFNIKAGANWDGDYIEKTTVEFKHGKAVTENARFRAYDSYEDSFRDYVNFLKASKRYEPALAVADKPAEYITGLQKAGYATDPEYANKIIRIMDREWQSFDKYSLATNGERNDV